MLRQLYFAPFLLLAGCAGAQAPSTDAAGRIAVSLACEGSAACFVANAKVSCSANPGFADCIERSGIRFDRESDTLTFDENLPSDIAGISSVPARIKLHGRAGTGAERDAEVSFAVSATPCEDVAEVAFLGFSGSGAPVLMTDQGPAEIVYPKIALVHEDARVVIDAETGSILDRLPAPHDNESLFGFQFESREDIYFFNADRCMSAPRQNGRLMTPAGDDCPTLRVTGKWENDRGLTDPTLQDVAIAQKALPIAAKAFGDTFGKRVFRIKSDSALVVNLVEACS